MDHHKFERIDKGVTRVLPPQPRSELGVYMPACPPEQREQIIAYALKALANGETTDQIAALHAIEGSTLRRWLLSDDKADKARKFFFDNELSTAREDIRTSETPFTLARAREDFRAVSFIAERRQAEYALKQEVKHSGTVGPLINIQLSGPQAIVPSADVHTQQDALGTPIINDGTDK